MRNVFLAIALLLSVFAGAYPARGQTVIAVQHAALAQLESISL
jgi:hypothetical protein